MVWRGGWVRLGVGLSGVAADEAKVPPDCKGSVQNWRNTHTLTGFLWSIAAHTWLKESTHQLPCIHVLYT